jgi:hypothetical protein
MNSSKNRGPKTLQDLKRMNREVVLEQARLYDEWKEHDKRNTQDRAEIEKMSSERGCGSVNEYLIVLGYLPDPTVKRPRTKIDPVKREEIVKDLKLGTLSTNDISLKYGVTVDAVYNIKSEAGLAIRREKVILTTTVVTPTSTVVVPTPPTDVPPAQEGIAA